MAYLTGLDAIATTTTTTIGNQLIHIIHTIFHTMIIGEKTDIPIISQPTNSAPETGIFTVVKLSIPTCIVMYKHSLYEQKPV